MVATLILYGAVVSTLTMAVLLLSGPTGAIWTFAIGTALPTTLGIMELIHRYAQRQAEQVYKEIVEQAKRDERSANMHGRPPFLRDGHGMPGTIYGDERPRRKRVVNPPTHTS